MERRSPMPKTIAAAALLLSLLAGSASGLGPEPEREKGRESGKDEIGKPLAELAAGKRDPRTLRIDVMWVEGVTRVSASLYGNGVAIWNDRAQVRVSRADILSIARALRDAGFGAMPSDFGEEGDLSRIRGKMEVSIAGKSKSVVQLASGEQSKVFSALASRIRDLVGKREKTGVTASSLDDALGKLSTGALAPEALRVIALRKTERPGPDAAAQGWLLQWEGRRVLARPVTRQGYGSQKRLELSDAETRSLAGRLREGGLEALPTNLYASDYMSLKIDVLQWSRDFLARRSPNLTPETHGELQKAFDRVIEVLAKLEGRAEREGRPEGGGSPAD